MKKVLVVGLCYGDSKKLLFELQKMFDIAITDVFRLDEAKEYLANNTSPDLIITNKIIHGDKSRGINLLDYLKEENISAPTLLFSRFEEAQQEALKHGATASFDLDLIIGYITPSRKEKHAKALAFLEEHLS